MALVITVTKEAVRLRKPNLYYINVNMVVTDDAVEVINQNFEANYSTGQNAEVEVKNLKNRMQEVIDNYIAEQVVYDHIKFDNAVTWLNANLIGGE